MKKVFLAVLTLLTISTSYAQPGVVDGSFGVNGIVTSQIPQSYSDLLVQPDGKIIVTGTTKIDSFKQFTLVRYNTNGSPDSSFGINGVSLMTITPGYDCTLWNAIILPDGKILTSGVAPGFAYPYYYNYPRDKCAALARFNADGTIDSTFGINGSSVVVANYDLLGGTKISLLPDGKIVVAGVFDYGYDYYNRIFLMRFVSNGSPDSSYGIDGIHTTGIMGTDRVLSACTEQSGTTALAYNLFYENVENGVNILFDTSGQWLALDNPALDILLQQDFFWHPNAGEIRLTADGKIVTSFGGDDSYSYNTSTALVRYNLDLSLDSSFADNGVLLKFNEDNSPPSFVVQPDGKIIEGTGVTLSRIKKSGVPDSSFTNSTFNWPYVLSNSKLNLEPDGKVLLLLRQSGDSIYEIRRFLNDTFTCKAAFTLVPDSLLPHHYWLLNNSVGHPPFLNSWNWGDGTTDSIAYPSHLYDTAGYYNICLTNTDSTGCTSNFCSYSQVMKTSQENSIIAVDVVESLPTQVQSSPSFQLLPLFPNPASEKLTVSLVDNKSEESRVTVYDLFGNSIMSFQHQLLAGYQQFQIPVTQLKNGLYLLEIKSASATKTTSFVKQ